MMLALLSLLLILQSPADRTQQLLDRLESADLDDREAIAAEIVKIGPSVKAAVLQRLETASGVLPLHLQTILRRVRREERMTELESPGPVVTTSFSGRPAAEALAEIRKQTRIAIEGLDLTDAMKVSLDLKNAGVWKAVDEVCRSNGRLMYSFDADRIVVSPGPYRRLPAFDLGPYRVVFDALESWRQGPTRRFDVIGAVLAPPGRLPDSFRLDVERFEDDAGVALPTVDYLGKGTFVAGPRFDLEVRPGVLYRPWIWQAGDGPDESCPRLKSFSGVMQLNYVVDRMRLLSLKNPLGPGVREQSAGSWSVEVREVTREGNLVHIRARFRRPFLDKERETGVKYGRYLASLYDAKGARLRHRQPESDITFEEELLAWTDVLTVDVSHGEPAFLDVEEVFEVHTVKIPFNLDGVALK